MVTDRVKFCQPFCRSLFCASSHERQLCDNKACVYGVFALRLGEFSCARLLIQPPAPLSKSQQSVCELRELRYSS